MTVLLTLDKMIIFFFEKVCHWNCVIYYVQGLQYGANWSWCGHCHHKLRFQIESTRFHQLQSSALDTSGWLTIFVFCFNRTIRSLVLNVSHYMHNVLCNSIHYRPIHEFKLVCKLMYFLEHSGTFRFIVPEHWSLLYQSAPISVVFHTKFFLLFFYHTKFFVPLKGTII